MFGSSNAYYGRTEARFNTNLTWFNAENGLELRQVPGLAPIAVRPAEIVAPAVNPPVPGSAAPPAAVPPVGDPLAAPAAVMPPANQAVPPAPPAAVPGSLLPTTTMPRPPLVTGDDFITVQWIETHIGNIRTWIPKTETFHFEPMSQAPLPGVGGIGMGTLTGKTGQTQTIYMVVGAAPTAEINLRKGIAAAMAVGIAGLVV